MKPIAIQVSPKLTRATADCWYGSLLPSSERYGANAGRARKLAMVNSPMTMARVRNAPLSSATRRFGRMIRDMTVNQPAPRLCDASVSARMSIARRPVSTARYMYGNDRMT